MTATIKGGFNIAMKVPPHQFDETVRFYRDVVCLEPFDEKAPEIGFKLGPNRLWIDKAPMLRTKIDARRDITAGYPEEKLSAIMLVTIGRSG